jgi:hypothetical protein
MNFSRLIGRFGHDSNHKHAGRGVGSVDFDQYDGRPPSQQNAIDLVPGWTGSFPEALGLKAGHLALHADPRIAWALDRYGSLAGRDVLEIGPLEGMHTSMLHQQMPRKIDAIEANRFCYLRCLITDQILKLDRANFLLGDAMEWLEEHEERYDLIVASGVLYHMSDPVRLLELAASRSDSLFLWTHYFTPEALSKDDVRYRPFTGKEVLKPVRGLNLRLYERHYHNAAQNASFCGGPRDRHYWMHRQDIVDFLGALGFNSIEIDGDDEDHPGGPCFSILARRV